MARIDVSGTFDALKKHAGARSGKPLPQSAHLIMGAEPPIGGAHDSGHFTGRE